MRVMCAGQTDVGLKRTKNEDSFVLIPEEGLYVVADGMGGHKKGEVASQMAVETMKTFFRMSAIDEEVTWPYREEKNLRYDESRLVAAIKYSNMRIYEAATRDDSYHKMGTTIVSAFFSDRGAYLGHVGDSRGYRIRNGTIEQITEDHSLRNEYIKSNKLTTQEEIDQFPSNVISRALGICESVQVDINRLSAKPDDYYLLCSDGLTGPLADKQILEITMAADSLEEACSALIDQANEFGGPDNITVALAHLVED